MRYMLDTCTLIYMIFNPERLSPAALKIVEGNHALYASIASVWEIMIKEQIDHIRFLPTFKDHGDPFDRLIISQAMDLNLPIITSDQKFARYPIKIIW